MSFSVFVVVFVVKCLWLCAVDVSLCLCVADVSLWLCAVDVFVAVCL